MLGIGLEADRHLIGVAAMSNAIFDVTTPDGGGESYVRAHPRRERPGRLIRRRRMAGRTTDLKKRTLSRPRRQWRIRAIGSLGRGLR
jgi:hypothetical protein